MYDCKTLDDSLQTCVEWVASDASPHFGLSQDDSYILGQFFVGFLVLCCVYAVIVRAIKIT